MKLNFKKLFVLISILFMASCSTNPSNSSSSNNTKLDLPEMPTLVDNREENVKMKTITTLNGDEVTYNANTRKIVALGCAGDILSLGLRPLAVDGNANSNGYEDYFYGVEKLKNTQPFDPEEVLSYYPDLILTYDTMEQKDIAKLEKIAPVIPIYFSTYDYNLRISYLGDIFDMQENSSALISFCKDLEEKSLKSIENLKIKDKTVTVFSYMNGICIPPDFNGAFVFNHILYDILNFGKNEKVEQYLNNQAQPAYSPISSEKLREYEGDFNIYASMDETDTSIPDVVKTNEGWKSLKCVKENHVGVINIILFSLKDVLYMAEQYQSIFNAIEQAL